MEKYYETILIGSGRGFGFAKVEGVEEDFFIPPNKMYGALDGDKVVIEPCPDENNPNLAEVKKILEYANQQIIGTLAYGMMGNYVVADNPRIHKTVLIKPIDLNGANVGDKVVVKVTAQPSGDADLLGEITEVLGKASERSVMEKAIVRANRIPDVFPSEVTELAESFGQTVSEIDKAGRRDLTKEITFTIDGDDSKDLDDAISIEKLENGNYKLGVHIADVGNYVKKGNAIDIEAYKRGTSVYFPGYVIPMLPTTLSNGICSLNEGEDRLTLTCEMEINEKGDVVNHDIFESVIRTTGRLTYDLVYATLKGEETPEKYQKLKDKFILMEELTNILNAKKDEMGYLEFDLPETYYKLNEKGELLEVYELERHIAHEMIEAFMIVANETVAEHFYERNIPFVYRVHEVPLPEKSASLAAFMEGLGLNPVVFSKNVSPKEYQTILKMVDGEPYEQALNKVLLMSLQKARYHDKCLGHFGLASTYYTHFTSPIRRYSDLTIHRIIKDYLHKNVDTNDKQLKLFVQDASVQASETEQRAVTAERQVEALKKAEYMQKHIGEVYEGVVNGVMPYGVFVELENTVEGLIHIENLPVDEYTYIENTMTLKGHNHSYSYGDSITIRVAGVNLAKRQVDFCEVSMEYTPRDESKDRPRRPKLDKKKLDKKKFEKGKGDRVGADKFNKNGDRNFKQRENKNFKKHVK